MKNDFKTVIKEVAAFLGKEVTLDIYPEKDIESFIVAIFLHVCLNVTKLRLMNPV